MFKNAGLFLLNIFLIIAVMIGLAMGAKPLTGKTWQAWLGNDDLIQTQQHINDLEQKLSGLEKTQATLLAMESKPIIQADTLIKKQKMLWFVIRLQQKFWSGEPYAEEWSNLVSLLPPSILQDPSMVELSQSASAGIMTKHKLRKLLLAKKESTATPAPQPTSIWDYLKDLVKIERVLPGILHEEVLVALEQEQLENYIAHHPDYAWARIPLQDLNQAHALITNFYKILDTLILAPEKS